MSTLSLPALHLAARDALAAAMPSWRFHPEVWAVMAVVGGVLVLVARAAPERDDTSAGPVRRQRTCATGAVVGLLCALGWPLRDAAEVGAAWAAALSLLLLTVVVPPLLVGGVPAWAARRLQAGGSVAMRSLRWATRPAPALVIEAGALVLWRLAADPVIYGALPAVALAPLLVLAGSLVWIPVVGPWTLLRVRVPTKLVVLVGLALQLVLLGLWTASGDPAGRRSDAIWDLGAGTDILLAGVVIVLGSVVPLAVAAVVLTRWVRSGGPASEKAVVVAARRELTAGDVVREFDRLGPPRHVEGDGEPPSSG